MAYSMGSGDSRSDNPSCLPALRVMHSYAFLLRSLCQQHRLPALGRLSSWFSRNTASHMAVSGTYAPTSEAIMIANVLNTLVGLWLAYVSIFALSSAVTTPWRFIVAALVIIVLAVLARRSDYSGWQSATNIVLALVLAFLMLAEYVVAVPTLVLFWLILWIGLTVASLALWAALYDPEGSAEESTV